MARRDRPARPSNSRAAGVRAARPSLRASTRRVVRPLGGGAYGSVYLVEKDGELYALKLARFLGNSGDARHTDERATWAVALTKNPPSHPYNSLILASLVQ